MESFFKKNGITPPKEDEFELTFFGPGYGESIVVYLPTIGWGVIDSCVFNVNKSRFIPPLEYLSFLSVKYLEFIMLTHPHKDHYLGMDGIINAYMGRVNRICRYHGEGLRELITYLTHRSYKGALSLGRAPDLVSLGDIFSAFKRARENGADLWYLSAHTIVVPPRTVNIRGTDLTIMAISLSPLAEDEENYIRILREALPRVGHFLKDIPDVRHNLVSSAISISVSGNKAILGSDVERGTSDRSGWQGIVNSTSSPELAVRLLKVPHHGSRDAYCEDAWDSHCRFEPIFSIVTPFSASSIPTDADIERIRHHSRYTGLTSASRYKPPSEVYSMATARQIDQRTKSWKVVDPPTECGMITVRYDIGGNETLRRAIPPARIIEN